MVDKIVYTYKFTTLPNIDDLRDECKVWLTTILEKYDPNKGSKAFSYFSVVTKNWFIHKVKKNTKRAQREVDYEDAQAEIAEKMVELEDKFIDLSFGTGAIEGLTAKEVKEYIRYIADRRLISMGMKGIYKRKVNPLPWVEEMINAPTHTNFFENRATDYAKGSLKGSWSHVWGKAA